MSSIYGLFNVWTVWSGVVSGRVLPASPQERFQPVESKCREKEKKKERSFTAFVVEKSVEPELADPTF